MWIQIVDAIIRIIPEVITVGTAFSKGELGWWNDELYENRLNINEFSSIVRKRPPFER